MHWKLRAGCRHSINNYVCPKHLSLHTPNWNRLNDTQYYVTISTLLYNNRFREKRLFNFNKSNPPFGKIGCFKRIGRLGEVELVHGIQIFMCLFFHFTIPWNWIFHCGAVTSIKILLKSSDFIQNYEGFYNDTGGDTGSEVITYWMWYWPTTAL